MSFKNKVVLITGGSSGIGAAAAVLFTKEGASVAIVGRNETKLRAVAAQCEKTGSKPLVIKADVAKDEDAKAIIKKTIDAYKRLDVLVNNAGVLNYGTVLDGKLLETYDTTMSINLRAVIHLTSLSAPYLVESKGNIINISSILGSSFMGSPSSMAYCISKAGLDHFTRGAALELMSTGVRINTVSPGPVRTDILKNSGSDRSWEDIEKHYQLDRTSEPEEIADMILFLAGDKAKSVTGANFVVDNGCLAKHG